MEAIGSSKKYQRVIRITIGHIVYIFYQFAEIIYFQFMFNYQNNTNFVFICLMFSSIYLDFVYISSALI